MKSNKKVCFWGPILVTIIFMTFSLYCWISFQIKENFESQQTRIHYHVITLGTEERLANIKIQQGKIKSNIHLFQGTVGKTLDLNSVQDPIIDASFAPNYNIEKDATLRKNEIGCYLSHYYLYQEIARKYNHTGYTVIFEDDFIIDADFEKNLTEGLHRFQEKPFDILYLANSSDNIGPKTDNQPFCYLDSQKNLWGTHAYLVNNSSIDKLIQETKHMKKQIDVQLADSIFNKKLTAYTFCPFIAKYSGELESTI